MHTKRMNGIRRTLVYLKKYWKPALAALGCTLLVNAANLLTPQLLRILIDNGISRYDMNVIWTISGGLVLVAVVRGVFNFLQGYLSEVTSQGVAYELRNTVFEKLQRLSFSYHDRSQTGKLMTHMTSDVEMVRMFVGSGLIQLISAVILLIGTLVILFSMNALLTSLFFLMLPPIGLIFMFFIRRLLPFSMVVQEKLGALNNVLQENLAGIRVVKAFAREDHEYRRFQERNVDLREQNVALIKLFSSFFPVIFFVANLGVVAVVWVGGLQVIQQQISIGELVAFLGYQAFFLMPMFMLGFVGSLLSRAEASAQRIFEVLDAQSDVADRPGAMDVPALRGEVRFEDVSFRYMGAESDVIKHVNFEARPNQTVAILGRTGSGKSSIINLIPRFYDVSAGRVLIDQVDVRDLKLSSLRAHIGIVLQETTLFSGTIRDNIAYGKPEASQEEVEAAARMA
ncbi:MAG: ABC transporter ATP-binding protein, partial [Chloroflexi bacterium]|nr:ABC transporter ATP-binding protein [Chloroflexota bacterium]